MIYNVKTYWQQQTELEAMTRAISSPSSAEPPKKKIKPDDFSKPIYAGRVLQQSQVEIPLTAILAVNLLPTTTTTRTGSSLGGKKEALRTCVHSR
jgi:hypothetical protein